MKRNIIVIPTSSKMFLNILEMIDDVEEKGEACKKQFPEKSKTLKNKSNLWIIWVCFTA